ncbi:MAG: hypothetical protein KAU27_08255 [Desulfuromonadales bacterium]|nr:hypothetical protein [Desulfuromonadales bacterium]
MKEIKLIVLMVMSTTSVAYAATSAQSEGSGVLTYFFLGFFALIIVSQLVPAMILFFGMVKGLFTSSEKVSTKNN